MAFPDITTLSPQDGAIHTIGENKFVFSTATGKWEKARDEPIARFDPPAVPYNGQLWFDTDTTGRLYIWNEAATSWIQLTGHQLDGGGNATTGYVDTAIANLIDSSPTTLNTLNEIAQAIGDDPNFGTSITSSVVGKLNTSDFTTTANSWASTSLNLNTLVDVSNNPPAEGQVLSWDNNSQVWYAKTPETPEQAGAIMSGSNSTSNMSFVIDEDTMASNLDNKVPTQQSVKSFVDARFSTFDLSIINGNLDNIDDGFNFVKSSNNFTDALKNKLEGTLDDISDGDSFVKSQNNLTPVLKTKLDGITPFADVTGTANVTAAGAVMASTFSTHLPGSGAVLISTLVSDLVNTDEAVMKSSSSGSMKLPQGTTAQRDTTAETGFFRWNTTNNSAEVYDGSVWGLVGGGNTTREVMWQHSRDISSNYQISAGDNAVAAGSITIDSGGSIEIPSGSTWSIV